MTNSPETRDSLLVRVRDMSDHESWSEFVEIYSPMIYRTARHRGMQHSDAEDLTQSVLFSVSRCLSDWQRDEGRSGFRGWLARVTRNAIINAVTRKLSARPVGGSDFHERISAVEDSSDPLWERIEAEHRRSILRAAAARVRPHVDPSTWAAFWSTTIDQQSPSEVARELGMSVGAVYCAKARVMRRLAGISTALRKDWACDGEQET